MAANPLGAHQVGSSFRRPHGWYRPAMFWVGRADRAELRSRHALVLDLID